MNNRNELAVFKTRWRRWLGQKTRSDGSAWATLLNCNWSGWAAAVLESHGIEDKGLRLPLRDGDAPLRASDVKSYFARAIECADMRDLIRLDNLYCADKIKRKGL